MIKINRNKTGLRIIITVTNDVVHDRRMLRISRTLIQAGYRVTLVGRTKARHKKVLSEEVDIKLFACIFNSSFLFYAEYNIRLFLYLLFQKTDLIYAVDLDTIAACGVVARIKRTAWIFDSHEYFTEVPELEGKRWIKSCWTRIGQRFIKHADMRITVGQSIKQALERKYDSPFHVIRNVGPKYKFERKVDWPKTKELVYLGVLNEGRGLPELIRAIKVIPDVKLTLLGAGDIQDDLSSLVQEEGLGDRVRFLGQMEADEVMPELTKYHVGVNLLETRSESYRLSLANKCFDYIQAELPSLQMNFPEYQTINAQYRVSYLIDDLSVANIRAGILALIYNADVYDVYRQNCINAKVQYCWEEEEKHLLQLIETIK